MPKTKLAVTLDADLVGEAEKIKRLTKTRLARECAKLDPKEERALAEQGLAGSRDTRPSTEGRHPVGRPEPGARR